MGRPGAISLEQLLNLVGELDDAPGDDTARERCRRFLRSSVGTAGSLRDYVEACLRVSGPQYSRALQDLVNHAGTLIGFAVEFGRYQGVAGAIGYDGLWRSGDFSVAVEVKTSEVYAIKTATLVGYIDDLISEQKVPNWDHVLGLYVVGRANSELRQLENAIIAERRTHQLRVANVEDVLALAELVQGDDISHEEALALLQPVRVRVGATVSVLSRIANRSLQLESEVNAEPHATVIQQSAQTDESLNGAGIQRRVSSVDQVRLHLLTPVANNEGNAETIIRDLLSRGWYVFGDRTPHRKRLKPGDRICFYQAQTGVVATAEISSTPTREIPPPIREVISEPERFPWSFQVSKVRYFFDEPVVIDAELRAQLDAFRENDRDPNGPWSWLVQGTVRVSDHDFQVLTGQPIG